MNTSLVQMPVSDSKKKPKPKDTTPSVWNPEWKFTRAEQMGENYLQKKFKRIQREQKLAQEKKVRRIK